MRFVLYSHDGLGLGHFRRNLVLAQAIVERQQAASVLLACSAEGIETFSLPPRVDVLRLPGLRKVDNGVYVGRRLALAPPELAAMRASLLSSAVFHFRPHVILADKHPLGVRGELVPALGLQQRDGRRAALGLRDVLDDPVTTGREWREGGLRDGIVRFYQRILVYGTPGFLNPLADSDLPPPLLATARFCGYVLGTAGRDGRADDLPPRDERPLVVAAAGGGEDGLPILEAFLRAAHGAPWQGVVVAGPQMELDQWQRLRTLAERTGASAYRSVRDVERWYPHADALVVMGGYNTIVEAVASGTPTVCVPRTQPRTEQLVRATAFAARGLLSVVESDGLSVGRLRSAIDEALTADRPALRDRARSILDLGGAARAADHLLELAGEVGAEVDPTPISRGRQSGGLQPTPPYRDRPVARATR